VSNSGDNGARSARDAFAELEGAVNHALDRLSAMTERAEAAEKKSAELNELMRRFSGSPEQAGDVLTRLKRLEDENADLKGRLEKGRAGVDRLLAKVRFLEGQG